MSGSLKSRNLKYAGDCCFANAQQQSVYITEAIKDSSLVAFVIKDTEKPKI